MLTGGAAFCIGAVASVGGAAFARTAGSMVATIIVTATDRPINLPIPKCIEGKIIFEERTVITPPSRRTPGLA
jgi:hypothetical protein